MRNEQITMSQLMLKVSDILIFNNGRIRAKMDPLCQPPAASRNARVQDIRNDAYLFYNETCFRLLRNLFLNNSFILSGPDIFHRICFVMTTHELLKLFHDSTTKTIRKDLTGREYACISNPKDEDPMHLLYALYRHPQSNVRFRLRLSEWLDYAADIIAQWQQAKPDPAKTRLAELKQQFHLSTLEHKVLLASLAFHQILYCSDLFPSSKRERNSKWAALLGITEAQYRQAIDKGSKLKCLRFIDKTLSPNKHLIPYIDGVCDDLKDTPWREK